MSKDKQDLMRKQLEEVIASERQKIYSDLDEEDGFLVLDSAKFIALMNGIFEGYKNIDKSLDGCVVGLPILIEKIRVNETIDWLAFLNSLYKGIDEGIVGCLTFKACHFEEVSFVHNRVPYDKSIACWFRFEDCIFHRLGFVGHGSFTLRYGLCIKNSKIGNLVFKSMQISSEIAVEGTEIGRISAEGTVFYGDLHFVECVLGAESFKIGEFSYGGQPFPVCFTNVNFIERLNFNNTTFGRVPLFKGCEGLEGTNFDHINIRHAIDSDYRQLEMLRMLKGLSQNDHDEYASMLFSSYELEARYGLILKKAKFGTALWLEKKISELYRVYSFYGKNLGWPIIWWTYIWVLTSFVYWGMKGYVCDYKDVNAWVSTVSVCGGVGLSFLYSLKMMLGPLGVFLNLDGIEYSHYVFKIIGVFQQVISSIMIFLWVLQIRKRFKVS